MFKRGRKSSEMIIHSHRNVSNHSTIYRMVDVFVQSFKDQVEFNDTEGLEITKSEYALAYSVYFDTAVQQSYDFDSLWNIICNKIICRVYLILKNSAGQVTQANGPREFRGAAAGSPRRQAKAAGRPAAIAA